MLPNLYVHVSLLGFLLIADWLSLELEILHFWPVPGDASIAGPWTQLWDIKSLEE